MRDERVIGNSPRHDRYQPGGVAAGWLRANEQREGRLQGRRRERGLRSGTSAKTGLNDADKNSRQSITEATSRAATNVRSSRTLKVMETREAGEETRVTRKLRNQNTCHTLTTTFFEILGNYTVATYLRTEAIRLVLLLPSAELSKIGLFDRRTCARTSGR